MSLSTEQLEFLAQRGMSLADVIAFSRLSDAAVPSAVVDEQAERRRAADRERKRNLRNVCGKSADAPNDIYSNPETITPEQDKSCSTPQRKSSHKRKSNDGDPVPDDWQPILTPAAQKIVDGWPPGWLDTRLAEFRDHASDKRRRSNDWQAAFRTWLSKADEWGRQKNGKDRKNGAQTDRGGDGFMLALREAAGAQATYPDADYRH